MLGIFASLYIRDFRYVLANNAFASLGMGMDFLTQGWLVLTITDSPFWVGVVAGLRGAGLVAFGPLGGVIVDRVDRRKALIVAQAIWAQILLVLGILIVTDNIELWHVLIASPILGMVFGVVLPANNALIYGAVGPQRLLNAMASRMVIFNLTRMVGSVVAGALITTFGIGACYIFIASSLGLSGIPLLFVKSNVALSEIRESIWHTFTEGLRYVRRNSQVMGLLALSVLMEMYGFSFLVMLPVIAREVLDVGASGLGLLSAANGFGAFIGTLTLASMGNFKDKATMLTVTSGATGFLLVLFGLSPWFGTSLVLAGMVGGAIMAYDATMATVLQLVSTNEMRGRVLGLYGLTFGFTHVGGFFSGIVATLINAPFAIGFGGLVIVSYVIGFLRRSRFENLRDM